MQSFEILKGQGGVPKILAGKDHVCGMVFYLPQAKHALLTTAQKECVLGAASDVEGVYPKTSTNADVAMMRYHLSEVFRMNAGAKVWVKCIASGTGDAADLAEVATVQQLAQGECRQIGVWNGYEEASATHIVKLQTVATELEKSGKNCSIVYSAKVDVESLQSAIYAQSGNSNVSMVIGQDLTEDGEAKAVAANMGDAQLGAVGTLIGSISLAKVNESIAWVQKFNCAFDTVGFQDGTPLNALTTGELDTLDSKQFIYLVKYDGIAGSYWSDSHTLDIATSDYATIEAERTIDKACRGVRTYLLPQLGAPVYLTSDGKLRRDTLDSLQNTASQALEQMERDGELSGYAVEIDPEQNVLANSTLEFVIKNVAVGVMRRIKIKIGYTQSIE